MTAEICKGCGKFELKKVAQLENPKNGIQWYVMCPYCDAPISKSKAEDK